jgi:hypothetical protein
LGAVVERTSSPYPAGANPLAVGLEQTFDEMTPEQHYAF